LLLATAVAVIVLAFRVAGSKGGLRPPDQRRPLSPINLPTLDGQHWSLEEQKGSVVLLNFWATWCGPCRMETPELVTLAQTYGPRGFRVAGITMDEQPALDVPEFVRRYRVPYPILIPGSDFMLGRSIESLPTTMLFDRQGRLARLFIGARSAEDIAPDVEKLLAEQP
jgi:cytochrome c biogenesis protein CcmG/thiol:disulfide interchange protein DsbE